MTASYRFQLHPEFGFADVQALLPYLGSLGVSHLYLSPVTEARRGSTHGYDVIDHNEVRAAFGGREGLDRLLAACVDRGLKVILDWVPNHAGVGPRNAYWQDVLAYGPNSPYARYFDVDWRPLKPELDGKVHLPFLGRPYGEALDEGEIGLGYADGRFYATYFESRFALAPATYGVLLEAALTAFERTDPYWDLKNVLETYRGLGPAEREKAEALRLRLATLVERADANAWLTLPPAALHDLLEAQCWRLSYWKTAGSEINYRRFFDINELVGLRMEDDQVFWDAHRLLGELLAHEAVDGVRIDHVDGMFHPEGYLQNLRLLGARRVWVEKILAPGEPLPEAWPVEGETGYVFMNDALHLLLHPDGEAPLDRAYRRFTDDATPYADVVYRSKGIVMETMLSSELLRLAYELDRISEADYHTRDFTLEALREALEETVAAFDRYRTYIPHDPEGAREVVLEAVYRARQRNPAAERSVYDFLTRVVLGDVRDDLREMQQAWVGRFQQYTAPVAAKGVEDTAFYRYLRLSGLNEVGGEPDHWALPLAAFHARARFRAHRYPHSLVATATHDHKRGEDTRMRLVALAEVPELWEETAAALEGIAPDHLGSRGPSARDRYLLYQTLAALWEPSPHGAAPEELADRLWAYAQKAAREAKLDTSWIDPDEAYEADLEAFVRTVVADPRTAEAVGPLAERLAALGFQNTITQAVLKLTTPGVPDFYQGTELLDLSLVDPDNRRPVDYGLRQRMLDELSGPLAEPSADALRGWVEAQDEQAKFYVTARLLRLRRERPALFAGDYRALDLAGDGADAWVAYARQAEGDALVVLASRYPSLRDPARNAILRLPKSLASGSWTEWLTGEGVDASGPLATEALPLPWAVLVGPA